MLEDKPGAKGDRSAESSDLPVQGTRAVQPWWEQLLALMCSGSQRRGGNTAGSCCLGNPAGKLEQQETGVPTVQSRACASTGTWAV